MEIIEIINAEALKEGWQLTEDYTLDYYTDLVEVYENLRQETFLHTLTLSLIEKNNPSLYKEIIPDFNSHPINRLTPEQRVRWFNNLVSQDKNKGYPDYKGMKKDPNLLIIRAFNWHETPEGHEYWNELDDQIMGVNKTQEPTKTKAQKIWDNLTPTQQEQFTANLLSEANYRSEEFTTPQEYVEWADATKHTDPSYFIRGAFVPILTEQGKEYWQEVIEELKSKLS